VGVRHSLFDGVPHRPAGAARRGARGPGAPEPHPPP
jgi:hypothetical protein